MSAGPPFVAGEVLCPKCAGVYKTDIRFPGHAPPAMAGCVMCGRKTRCRVRG